MECVENIRIFTSVKYMYKKKIHSRDGIYLVVTEKIILFLFNTFYRLHAMSHPLNRDVLKMTQNVTF